MSLPSPNHGRLSTCVELNRIFCSPYRCPSCLLGSFCSRSLVAPPLGLFPLATRFPLFWGQSYRLSCREISCLRLSLFPGSRGWRALAGVHSGPLTFTCQAGAENLGKVSAKGLSPSLPALSLFHILSTRAWSLGPHGHVSACCFPWNLPELSVLSSMGTVPFFTSYPLSST